MKAHRALAALLVFAASCSLGGSSGDADADELAELATNVTTATYAAIYKFGYKGSLAGAVTTRMEIVQDPPSALRKLETTTPNKEGKPISLRSWHVSNAQGDYACTDYEDLGLRCIENPNSRSTFNMVKPDAFFDTPRDANAFASVRRVPRSVRIQGEEGTCFEAVPVAPTQPPITSPQPALTPDRFRYELCYAEDGILLRGRETSLGEVEGGRQSEALVEIVSLSRVVEPRELRLPGPLVDVEEVLK